MAISTIHPKKYGISDICLDLENERE